MKVVENKYSAIVKDEPTRPLEKIKEYDNDDIHYIHLQNPAHISQYHHILNSNQYSAHLLPLPIF